MHKVLTICAVVAGGFCLLPQRAVAKPTAKELESYDHVDVVKDYKRAISDWPGQDKEVEKYCGTLRDEWKLDPKLPCTMDHDSFEDAYWEIGKKTGHVPPDMPYSYCGTTVYGHLESDIAFTCGKSKACLDELKSRVKGMSCKMTTKQPSQDSRITLEKGILTVRLSLESGENTSGWVLRDMKALFPAFKAVADRN
jgi:hypothetical protein